MLKQHRWPREAWMPFATGLGWLWYAYSFGTIGFLFAIVLGCILLSAWCSTLLYPGDSRIPQFIALGGIMGVVLALPALVLASVPTALLLILLSAVSFFCSGAISLRQEPRVDEAPEPEPSTRRNRSREILGS